MKVLGLMLGIFVTTPIWFYLLYKILESVNASELMWFLYIAYIPTTIICSIIITLSDEYR